MRNPIGKRALVVSLILSVNWVQYSFKFFSFFLGWSRSLRGTQLSFLAMRFLNLAYVHLHRAGLRREILGVDVVKRSGFSFFYVSFFFSKWCKKDCYSINIFLRFWLAKITRIIHHNQQLLTKIFAILNRWRRKFSKVADYWTVKQENLGTSLSCFRSKLWLCMWVMAEHFTRFTANYCLKTWHKKTTRATDDMHLLFGVFLQTWTAFYLLNFPIKMLYRYWTFKHRPK